MLSRILFVFGNSKTNPYILQDEPYPGFEVLSYDNQSYVLGTLYSLGHDAGFVKQGYTKVWGQTWVAPDAASVREFGSFLYPRGNVRTTQTKAIIKDEAEELSVVVSVFELVEVPLDARKLSSGMWHINRRG